MSPGGASTADAICVSPVILTPCVAATTRCLIDLRTSDMKRIPVANHSIAGSREAVMAWIEQTGQHAWRVRYQRDTGRYGSISGFSNKKAATDYANDLESDRRR